MKRTLNKTYASDALAEAHEMAESLHELGMISKKTMREFDAECLTPIEQVKPEEIKRIRETENISQQVFAMYMNVSKNLISDWERGVKNPGGPALRLLTIAKHKGLKSLA